jgi:hypothetical protein
VRTLKRLRQPGVNTHHAPATKIGAIDFRLRPDVARADTLSPGPETNPETFKLFPKWTLGESKFIPRFAADTTSQSGVQ